MQAIINCKKCFSLKNIPIKFWLTILWASVIVFGIAVYSDVLYTTFLNFFIEFALSNYALPLEILFALVFAVLFSYGFLKDKAQSIRASIAFYPLSVLFFYIIPLSIARYAPDYDSRYIYTIVLYSAIPILCACILPIAAYIINNGVRRFALSGLSFLLLSVAATLVEVCVFQIFIERSLSKFLICMFVVIASIAITFVIDKSFLRKWGVLIISFMAILAAIIPEIFIFVMCRTWLAMILISVIVIFAIKFKNPKIWLWLILPALLMVEAAFSGSFENAIAAPLGAFIAVFFCIFLRVAVAISLILPLLLMRVMKADNFALSFKFLFIPFYLYYLLFVYVLKKIRERNKQKAGV